MSRHPIADRSILEAALIGFQHQLAAVEAKIAELRRRVRTADGNIPMLLPSLVRKKRRLSAAARKRMSEATKKRWAAYRRQHKGR